MASFTAGTPSAGSGNGSGNGVGGDDLTTSVELDLVLLPGHRDEVEQVYRFARDQYFLVEQRDNKLPKLYLTLYVGAMVKLGLNQELFYLGHQIVNKYPQDALSWYTVGSYYYACDKFDQAHKYLKKALKKDPQLALGWILLGHIMSQQEESEQAVAAFRSAVRLLPNHFLPLLCLGKEFIRTNNLSLAAHTLTGSRALCPMDPLVLSELGCVFVRLDRLPEALQFFNWALSVVQLEQQETFVPLAHQLIAPAEEEKSQPQQHRRVLQERYARNKLSDEQVCEIMYNFATTLRKMREYDEAIAWYQRCLSLGPQRAQTLAALGFTYHLAQHFQEAITYYHRALGVQPHLSLCGELLTLALEDVLFYQDAGATAGQQSSGNSTSNNENQASNNHQNGSSSRPVKS